MIHFDDVLAIARDTVRADVAAAQIAEVLVLRDLRGRIRLFLKPAEGNAGAVEAACARLSVALAQAVEPFWGDVVEVDSSTSRFQTLLASVRQERQPIGPDGAFPGWYIIERHAAKSAWTSSIHRPPWPLNANTPAIVAFFSHKGGVGRSTALCATALNLARTGAKVVAVDLDLEAPGLGTLLAGSPVEYGLADYLLERVLAGNSFSPSIEQYAVRQVDPVLIGETGEPVVCVPAGKINEHYLEKLSRLDYELLVPHPDRPDNPLGDLLIHVKRHYKPNYIFVDCRAGLHDLGGLAVQTLSHANVIFGLDSRQSWDGMRCLVRRLGLVKVPPPCLLIQSMEQGTPGALRDEARERFRTESYNVFCDEFYEERDVPDIGAVGEAHDPFPLAYDQNLSGYQTLAQVAELLLQGPYPVLAERVRRLAEKAMIDVRT